MSLATQSITSLRAQLTAGDIRPRDIVQALAEGIEQRDGEIGSYLSHDLAGVHAGLHEQLVELTSGPAVWHADGDGVPAAGVDREIVMLESLHDCRDVGRVELDDEVVTRMGPQDLVGRTGRDQLAFVENDQPVTRLFDLSQLVG